MTAKTYEDFKNDFISYHKYISSPETFKDFPPDRQDIIEILAGLKNTFPKKPTIDDRAMLCHAYNYKSEATLLDTSEYADWMKNLKTLINKTSELKKDKTLAQNVQQANNLKRRMIRCISFLNKIKDWESNKTIYDYAVKAKTNYDQFSLTVLENGKWSTPEAKEQWRINEQNTNQDLTKQVGALSRPYYDELKRQIKHLPKLSDNYHSDIDKMKKIHEVLLSIPEGSRLEEWRELSPKIRAMYNFTDWGKIEIKEGVLRRMEKRVYDSLSAETKNTIKYNMMNKNQGR